MPETTRLDFLHPTKKCDVVMKGGITSGVVYPNMICKLAETYRFVSIGGTSAGAIAAAATAAAEYRRSEGSDYGFEKLSKLPSFFTEKPQGKRQTNLFWLFQPDDEARMLFDIGVSFTKKGWRRWAGVVAALIKGAPTVWLLVVLLAVVYSFYPSDQATKGTAFNHLSAALWMVQLLVGGLVVVIYRKVRRLPLKGFGLCPGMATNRSGPPALTEWLHGFLDDLAGKPQDEPLTFGDLSGKGIHLRMISTCVTHGRPYGLPFASKQFYFKESEIGAYFPAPVIEWMKRHPGPEPQGKEKVDTSGYLRLPHPADMPVVVAARMSLSFPFLFRAVPLYSVDFSLLRMTQRDENVKPEPGGALQPDQPRRPERCWFLDGGISSNFPISMFDAPLPRWPTFGIDLQPIRKDRPDSLVWMPSRNEEGLAEQWNRIADKGSIASIVSYIVGLIEAARNWTDNRQMTVPGYRDRIVHIRLDDKTEGGLNLDMEPEVVRAVSERGVKAADLLLSHFAKPDPDVTLTWDNHRWIRLRSFLTQFQEVFGRFQLGFNKPEPGDRSYTDLMERGRTEPPHSYRLTGPQREFIRAWLRQLLGIADELEAKPANSLPSQRSPRPVPDLRILPRTIPDPNADLPGATTMDPQTEGEVSVAEPLQE